MDFVSGERGEHTVSRLHGAALPISKRVSSEPSPLIKQK
jgi:hypothetical protein